MQTIVDFKDRKWNKLLELYFPFDEHRLLSNDRIQWQQVKEDDTLIDVLPEKTHNDRVEYLLDFNEDEACQRSFDTSSKRNQWYMINSHVNNAEQWQIAKVVNRESSVTIRDVSANPTRKQSVRPFYSYRIARVQK